MLKYVYRKPAAFASKHMENTCFDRLLCFTGVEILFFLSSGVLAWEKFCQTWRGLNVLHLNLIEKLEPNQIHPVESFKKFANRPSPTKLKITATGRFKNLSDLAFPPSLILTRNKIWSLIQNDFLLLFFIMGQLRSRLNIHIFFSLRIKGVLPQIYFEYIEYAMSLPNANS